MFNYLAGLIMFVICFSIIKCENRKTRRTRKMLKKARKISKRKIKKANKARNKKTTIKLAAPNNKRDITRKQSCKPTTINPNCNVKQDTVPTIKEIIKEDDNEQYENIKKTIIENAKQTNLQIKINELNKEIEDKRRELNKLNEEIRRSEIKRNYTLNEIKRRREEEMKNWQTVNKHGFSINRMYTYSSNGVVRSSEYSKWISDALFVMKKANLKSLEEMNVDRNKPMRLDIEFKLMRGFDTDNPIKSFIDLLVRHYGLSDDNNFIKINVTRDLAYARSYSEGTIKFKISNI